MKVFAVNSSPRTGGQSKTELMLDRLLEGMREAGAEIEVANLREKKIQHCRGCFSCWTRTPGRCILEDDMSRELYPQWKAADLAVYATPLYHYTVNARFKAFLERTLPSLEPFFEFQGTRMRHPLRHKTPSVAVLSVSGMPDESHFSPLAAYLDYLYGTSESKLVATIFRPAAEALTSPFIEDAASDVLAATRLAGRELVRSMRISPEVMARIRQPLMDPATFTQAANLFWKSCIAEGVTPRQFDEKNMVIRPDCLESFMMLLPFGINAEAADTGRVILQFTFSGAEGQPCHFIIENGRVAARTGAAKNADIVIETPFDLWMDIMTGKADGQQMYLEQRYTVSGDLALMLRLFEKAAPQAGA